MVRFSIARATPSKSKSGEAGAKTSKVLQSCQPQCIRRAMNDDSKRAAAKHGRSLRKPTCKDKNPALQSPAKRSVLQLLGATPLRKPCLRNAVRIQTSVQQPSLVSPARTVNEYIQRVLADVGIGRRDICHSPVLTPGDPAQSAWTMRREQQRNGNTISSDDVKALVLRPSIYVWAPHLLFPGLVVSCFACGSQASKKDWAKVRRLQTLSGSMVYATFQYRCCSISCKDRLFHADNPQFLASLPDHIKQAWRFVNTGKTLCDPSVVDYIRAQATRESWAAIADTLTEIREESWRSHVINSFIAICKSFDLAADVSALVFPLENHVTARWVRNTYMADYRLRETCLLDRWKAESGDNVLAIDWTVDAALRCRSKYLFNAMDGRGRILLSAFTTSNMPHSAKDFMADLAVRGVSPKVIYVDCECCGAWLDVIRALWKDAYVRLDGRHAIDRLTQTTVSTQHPWHGAFCQALSQVLYTYDVVVMNRLRAACQRAGKCFSSDLKYKHVPRVIQNPQRLASDIESTLCKYQTSHSVAGPLLTERTTEAWRNLEGHVLNGCLCDPPEITMHSEIGVSIIGGERFPIIRTLRGSSALEGFHAHQKQWLGTFARHHVEAGRALLADGATRWNAKRE